MTNLTLDVVVAYMATIAPLIIVGLALWNKFDQVRSSIDKLREALSSVQKDYVSKEECKEHRRECSYK